MLSSMILDEKESQSMMPFLSFLPQHESEAALSLRGNDDLSVRGNEQPAPRQRVSLLGAAAISLNRLKDRQQQ